MSFQKALLDAGVISIKEEKHYTKTGLASHPMYLISYPMAPRENVLRCIIFKRGTDEYFSEGLIDRHIEVLEKWFTDQGTPLKRLSFDDPFVKDFHEQYHRNQ